MILFATLVLAAKTSEQGFARDTDELRAELLYPRPHMRAVGPQAIRTKLNQQLTTVSSSVALASHASCDDFSLQELNALLLEVHQKRVVEFATAHGRRPRHADIASLMKEMQQEAAYVTAAPHLEEPIRHGKCHEVVMHWVHHLDHDARKHLSHLRLPLLPEKGTHEHAPELLRGGHHDVLQALAEKTSCQTGHAAQAEVRGNWTPADFPAWPFEVTYEAAGYGPYPFWAANTPFSGGLTGKGKLLSNTYSAVLNAEKLDHKGGCSLAQMGLGWSEDAPCTMLMLGSKYNYLYDNEEKSCCIASTPQGDCPMTPMKRDFYDLFELEGTVSGFKTESGSYSGNVKKYTMQINLGAPGPNGALPPGAIGGPPPAGGPFYFWYVTDESGMPVEQGEGACDSCIAPTCGNHTESSCTKTATVNSERACEGIPKFLFHQYNRTTFKSVTLDPSVFSVPAVCKNTAYSCAVTPADALCSKSKAMRSRSAQDVVVV